MAFLSKKKGQAREYETVYMGDKVVTNGSKTLTSPIFIRILRSTLVAIGAKDTKKVPGKEYVTNRGLKHKFYRDSAGSVWVDETGTKNGIEHANSRPITGLQGGNKLILTLTKKLSARDRANGGDQYEKVTIALPSNINVAQAFEWALSVANASKVQHLKYGDAKIAVGETFKKSLKSGAKGKDPEVTVFVPIAENMGGPLTKAGAIGKKAGSQTIIYAVMGAASALKFGFDKRFDALDEKEIIKGTSFTGLIAKSGGYGKTYKIFREPKAHNQIFTDAGKDTDTKTSITVTGTAVKVKVRFTTRNNTADRGAIKKKSSYAYFSVPAGTPVGVIQDAIMQFPARGRSFQVGSGSQFGKSYDLPVKNRASR
jgi:hypothetical protein